MIAEKTRKYLEMAMGNVSHADRELQNEVKKELSELEEYASKQLMLKPIYDKKLNNHLTKKEVELLKYALTYLSEAELPPENGWIEEDITTINDLIGREFETID